METTTKFREPDYYRSGRDRSRYATWIVQNNVGDGSTVEASLFAAHNKDQKYFRSSINVETVKNERGFECRTSSPMESTRVLQEPVARYSEKALTDFFKRSITEVQENYERYADRFDPDNAIS